MESSLKVDLEQFAGLLQGLSDMLSGAQQSRILAFYEFVRQESQFQNLTRLLSPIEFFEGHLLDVLELKKSRCLSYPAIDLGSGVGVPGLLAALIDDQPWILVESELRKADYLQKAVAHFQLTTQVRVIHQRVEVFLRSTQANEILRGLSANHFESIVVRAVGPVSRIYDWVRACSTWNSLILFKGPKWSEEWHEFQMGRFKNELHLSFAHAYCVGVEQKSRQILRLDRVVI